MNSPVKSAVQHYMLVVLAIAGMMQCSYAARQAHAAPAESALDGCPAVIVEVFGDRAADACYVSYRESHWQAGATGALGERGYFQIHPVHAGSSYDPYTNAATAYRLSSGGYDWCTHWRWTCV